MKLKTKNLALNEISSYEIENARGGSLFSSDPIESRNVINYYISFLPFTSRREYIEITREVEPWHDVDDFKSNTRKRTIEETATLKDLKWSNLNKSEKMEVLNPIIFLTFVFGSTAACAIARFIRGKN